MARTCITIVLDLDETTDRPAGSARIPGGPSREFHGWLGLTEAIDALTGGAGGAVPGVSDTDRHTHRDNAEGGIGA